MNTVAAFILEEPHAGRFGFIHNSKIYTAFIFKVEVAGHLVASTAKISSPSRSISIAVIDIDELSAGYTTT
ncbi:hypothetical protein DSO51_24500 [Salmonella enterica]|nr:hypothetical protein [Salmonella enterica]